MSEQKLILGIKPDCPDVHGRIYTKESLMNAAKEFVAKFNSGKTMGELEHNGTTEFDICWNQQFENEVRKKMLELLNSDEKPDF